MDSGIDGWTLPIQKRSRTIYYRGSLGAIYSDIRYFGSNYGFYYGQKKNNPVLKLSTLAFLLMVFGYTTYTQILLRSHANPPMNENEPKNFAALTSYLGREQYGDQKSWPRRTDYQDPTKIDIYNSKDANGEYVYGEWIPPVGKPVAGKDGNMYQVPSFDEVNTAAELKIHDEIPNQSHVYSLFLVEFRGQSQRRPRCFA